MEAYPTIRCWINLTFLGQGRRLTDVVRPPGGGSKGERLKEGGILESYIIDIFSYLYSLFSTLSLSLLFRAFSLSLSRSLSLLCQFIIPSPQIFNPRFMASTLKLKILLKNYTKEDDSDDFRVRF